MSEPVKKKWYEIDLWHVFTMALISALLIMFYGFNPDMPLYPHAPLTFLWSFVFLVIYALISRWAAQPKGKRHELTVMDDYGEGLKIFQIRAALNGQDNFVLTRAQMSLLGIRVRTLVDSPKRSIILNWRAMEMQQDIDRKAALIEQMKSDKRRDMLDKGTDY